MKNSIDNGHHCEIGNGFVCFRMKNSKNLFLSNKGPGAVLQVNFCPSCGYSIKNNDEEYLDDSR